MSRSCKICGAGLSMGARFCESCGARLTVGEAASPEARQAPVSAAGGGNISLCADGKYRWVYEFQMLKNPTVLFTVWRVLAVCACAPALITMLSGLKREGTGALLSAAKTYGAALLVILPVSLLAYFILAAIYGWKYIVLFEMDDRGIVHLQQPKQFKKAQGVAWLTMLAGRSGQGLLISSKNALSSDFSYVRSVKGLPRRNTIKLSEVLSHNQVYVEKEDFDFVWSYITSRCEKAKIR